MKRVLVCGGRDYNDLPSVHFALVELWRNVFGARFTVVHGAQRGADTLAATAATHLGMPVDPHPADWKRYSKAAGSIRNQEMLDSGVDLVLAFPGGAGTADMVRRARKAGVPVIEL